MLNNYMAVLSLNEKENNIKSLTNNRPLCSIPIGGRYRIIDFILSNLVNSNVDNIGLLTPFNSRSLMDHLGSGKPWDLNRKISGLFVFNFGIMSSYASDIEILKTNLEYLYRSKNEYVILSSSNMICNIDYNKVAQYYEESDADITIIYKKITDGKNNFMDCNVLNIDKDSNVLGIGENIGTEDSLNISMDMFIMKKQILIDIVKKCVQLGFWESLKAWIYKNLKVYKVNAYEFKGYVGYINSISSFYKVSKDMLTPDINRELFFKNGQIYTKIMDEPPTRYFNRCKVNNSLVANGCLIKGTVQNSIISREVTIGNGAIVKDCIIMQNCEIKENVVLNNVIIDKNNIIDANKELKGDKEYPLVIEKKRLMEF